MSFTLPSIPSVRRTVADLVERRPAPAPPPAAADAAPVPSRSVRVRRGHEYRGATVIAVLLTAAAAVTWFAAADVLAGVEGIAGWLLEHDGMLRRAVVVCALLTLAALAPIAAWGRATSTRKPVHLADGRGTIGVTEIAERLAAMLEERPGIRAAAVQVENWHHRGVRVDVRVQVGPYAQIDGTLDAVDDAADELLRQRLGVALDGLPAVQVTYDELQLQTGQAHDRGSPA